jgi:hypothetical protein
LAFTTEAGAISRARVSVDKLVGASWRAGVEAAIEGRVAAFESIAAGIAGSEDADAACFG